MLEANVHETGEGTPYPHQASKELDYPQNDLESADALANSYAKNKIAKQELAEQLGSQAVDQVVEENPKAA